MKRLLSVLLCMALLLSCNALPAYAGTGEGNIDNGGGNMGSGTAKNIWHTGLRTFYWTIWLIPY